VNSQIENIYNPHSDIDVAKNRSGKIGVIYIVHPLYTHLPGCMRTKLNRDSMGVIIFGVCNKCAGNSSGPVLAMIG